MRNTQAAWLIAVAAAALLAGCLEFDEQ